MTEHSDPRSETASAGPTGQGRERCSPMMDRMVMKAPPATTAVALIANRTHRTYGLSRQPSTPGALIRNWGAGERPVPCSPLS